MELLIAILSASIAAAVSLLVALISFVANRNALQAEYRKLERELQREMTAKLYDARLEVYPEAIAITDGLRRSQLAAQDDAVFEDYFRAILFKLDQWHSKKAFLLLSRNAVYTFYHLRKLLREPPELEGRYSPEQLDRIRRAKGEFRLALRSDIQILYREEMETLQDD